MKGIRLSLCLLLAACAADRATPSIGDNMSDAPGTVFVMSNGWHTGIVLARGDVPAGRIPETADFPAARFLEFGWGDAEYYPAQRPSFAMAVRAALLPTPAVVHVAGLHATPARTYPNAETVALALDPQGLGRLLGYIDASFERGGARRAVSSGPGLYAQSRFYPAKGRFHLANTCNSWTAAALIAAGFDVDRSQAARADDLMVQLRSIAMPDS